MKALVVAARFTLITTLAGLSMVHAAGFNDQSVIPNPTDRFTGQSG